VDDEVELTLVGHVPVGRVVAVLVLLAGREREDEVARRLPRCRCGLETAGLARLAGRDEAVEVLAAGLQARRLGVHRMCIAQHRQVLTGGDDLREGVVLRHLPLHRDGDVRHAAIGAQRRRREARPQHGAVGRRIAGGDAERERISGDPQRSRRRSRERDLRRQSGSSCAARDRQEAAA
jgi:hypothetical protein